MLKQWWQRERWKNKNRFTVIGKKATLHVQHSLSLNISLLLFSTATTWNFQKLPGYTFYGGNVVHVLVHFFPTVVHFHPVGCQHFSFSHCRCKISCCSSNKKCLLCFFYLALVLFFRWASLACHLTLSFSLSLSLFSKFVDMTINLNLIL